jgi:hypothetical protein
MRQNRFIPLAVLALLALASRSALAEQDSGSASEYPWSGYWWAHADGGLTPPLSKYDEVFGTESAAWEQANHVNVSNVQPWFGHCHAWSAASVTEKEPRDPRDYKGVNFGIGDQKGLLTAVHAQDEATSYGDRFGDGRGNESKADLPPDEVWRLLQLYVRQKNIPLIFDLEAGDEVWNYPVYQYEVAYQDAGGGYVEGSMQLVVADDDVHPDYLGTQPGIYTYNFRCKMQGGSVVSGSGQWIGESQNDHPDFAWYPYVARAENPDVDPAKVSQIVGYGVGGGSHPGDDDDASDPDDDGSDNGDDEPINDTPPPPSGGDGPGPAEPVEYERILSPIELVSLLSNKTSHFALDIFVDKNDGGRYSIGEPIRIAAESGREGYLYLFDVGPGGELKLIFPAPGEPNFIPADKLVDVPARDLDSWIFAELPGEHHLRGLVVAEPLALTGFHTQAQHKLKNKGKTKPKPEPGKIPRYEQASQKFRVPPATQTRVKQKLRGYYGTKDLEEKPPMKLGKAFAQDDCLFFVVAGEK